MIELAPNIYYLPGENKSRFPYCACLYIKGKDRRVLIDAGMGSKMMLPVKKLGIDLLILTHCHIDHRLTRTEIPDLIRWFELVHIEKHLMRLETMGKVRRENNKWIKC